MDGKPEGMGELVTKEFKYIGNFKVGKFVGGLTTPRTKKTLDSIDISANIVNEKIPDLADEFQNEQSITHQNKEESPKSQPKAMSLIYSMKLKIKSLHQKRIKYAVMTPI